MQTRKTLSLLMLVGGLGGTALADEVSVLETGDKIRLWSTRAFLSAEPGHGAGHRSLTPPRAGNQTTVRLPGRGGRAPLVIIGTGRSLSGRFKSLHDGVLTLVLDDEIDVVRVPLATVAKLEVRRSRNFSPTGLALGLVGGLVLDAWLGFRMAYTPGVSKGVFLTVMTAVPLATSALSALAPPCGQGWRKMDIEPLRTRGVPGGLKFGLTTNSGRDLQFGLAFGF